MALTDDLISYWELNEASGNAIDAHGSNDLTDNNTVGSAAGKINNARSFVSANTEFLSRATNADLETGDIDFTFSAWVNISDKSTFRGFITKQQADIEYILRYDSSTDRLAFYVSSDGSGFTSVSANNFGSPSTSTWYFVTCWHDAAANTINIQVNNGTPNSASHSTGVKVGTNGFAIGGRASGGELWDGLIDQVGFWKRKLTDGERTELYNSGNGLSYAGLTPSVPEITTTSLPNGVTGQGYSQTLGVTGGTGSITWSVTVGTLPDGLSLDTSTGAITGTPTVAGTFNFTVEAEDSVAATDTQALSITIVDTPPVIDTLGNEYHVFKLRCSIKDYSESKTYTTLENELSDGFWSSVLYGSNTGVRRFNLALPAISDWDSKVVEGPNGEFLTHRAYLRTLHGYTVVDGQPFAIQSVENDQYYLVRFADPTLSLERALSKLYSTGIELKQIRIPGVTIYDLAQVSPGYEGNVGYSFSELTHDEPDWTDAFNGSNVATDSGDVLWNVTRNDHPIIRLNSVSTDGVLNFTFDGIWRECFIVMKVREATFGQTSYVTPWMEGTSGETKFAPLGVEYENGDGASYRLNGIPYENDNRQAPMGVWGVVHVRIPSGMNGGSFTFGDASEVDVAQIFATSGLISTLDAREITEHLIVKWSAGLA